MHDDFPTIIGSIGVGLLLLAYLLNLLKRISQDSRLYTSLNISRGRAGLLLVVPDQLRAFYYS